jgi:hypothetical protein
MSAQILLLDATGQIKESSGSIPELQKENWQGRSIYEVIPLLESVLSSVDMSTGKALMFPKVGFNSKLFAKRVFNVTIQRCQHPEGELCFQCWLDEITEQCQQLIQDQQHRQNKQIVIQTK